MWYYGDDRKLSNGVKLLHVRWKLKEILEIKRTNHEKTCLIVAATVCLLGNSPTFAGGYTGGGTIRVMQSAFGGWLIAMNGDNANPDTCGKANILLLPSHSQYDELYSMLLAAYSSGRVINIGVDGCHSAGYKLFNFIYTSWN